MSEDGSERTASERIFAYGVQVAVLFTNIHGSRSFAIIGGDPPVPLVRIKLRIYNRYPYYCQEVI
jgi:hypothetical protein